nr:lipocalin family protein [uncultured Allomuricauda sp.]
MKKSLFLGMVLLCFSCSKSENNEQYLDLDAIMGKWNIIESGGKFVEGETFKEEFPCSNEQILEFHEDNLFTDHVYWGNGPDCEFDRTRGGEWIQTTRSDFPNANYRMIYYEIPGYDDGSTGYPEITFSSNRMKILY